MGRTHQQLTPQQANKLHKANQLGRVKGIHPTGGWLGPSTRSTTHLDTDYDSEDDYHRSDDYYAQILAFFYNDEVMIYENVKFRNDMYEALYEQDYGMVISLIVEFMEELVETYKSKLDNVDLFGNLESFDIEYFEIYLEKYFSEINEETEDIWMEYYKPNFDEE